MRERDTFENRFGICIEPRVDHALSDTESLDLQIAARVLERASRHSTYRRCDKVNAITRAVESELKGQFGLGSRLADAGIELAIFLWDRSSHLLKPAFGDFPFELWGTAFEYGEGVAGHSFRFERSATYDRSDEKSLIYLPNLQARRRVRGASVPTPSQPTNGASNPTEGLTPVADRYDWIVCVPLRLDRQTSPIGVVSLAGSRSAKGGEGESPGDRIYAAVVQHNRNPNSQAKASSQKTNTHGQGPRKDQVQMLSIFNTWEELLGKALWWKLLHTGFLQGADAKIHQRLYDAIEVRRLSLRELRRAYLSGRTSDPPPTRARVRPFWGIVVLLLLIPSALLFLLPGNSPESVTDVSASSDEFKQREKRCGPNPLNAFVSEALAATDLRENLRRKVAACVKSGVALNASDKDVAKGTLEGCVATETELDSAVKASLLKLFEEAYDRAASTSRERLQTWDECGACMIKYGRYPCPR